MCGIVGYIGPKEVTPILMGGLKSLEYRGYDSAGLAVLDGGEIKTLRSEGKLKCLENKLQSHTLTGSLGIGHTRWATHGKPVEKNAHPHQGSHIALVHNGIIENYEELKKTLQDQGVSFASDTDTEVIPWLIEAYLEKEGNIAQALYKAIPKLKGAFAMALFSKQDPETIYVAKNASPLIIGVGENATFLASDIPALLEHTRDVIILEDGQVAKLQAGHVEVTDFFQSKLDVTTKRISWTKEAAQKNGYDHFMLKEIHEQPARIADCLRGRLNEVDYRINFEDISNKQCFQDIKHISIIGCGTSYHAGLVGGYWLEKFAQLPVSVEVASEYRYRTPFLHPNTLTVAITQSGETADTVAACQLAKKLGAKTLSICNVVDGTIARLTDHVLYTHAGPEISVASTKAFTTQLTAFLMLTLLMARQRKTIEVARLEALGHELLELPRLVEETIAMNADLDQHCKPYTKFKDFLFFGRGASYPIALEGALKLKEISYIHAEGYRGGELKHGPIALIEEGLPVVALSQKSILNEKMKSNVEEVRARGAHIISVSELGDNTYGRISDLEIKIPQVSELVLPLIQTIPLQMLAYVIAKRKGCDIDQPRNLAKSVTVE